MPKMNKLLSLAQKLFGKSSLEGKGERVDISYQGTLDYDALDVYQKSHVKRYEFARRYMEPGKEVADLACGTGYGSVMLSEKSRWVTGVDMDAGVIRQVKKRYERIGNVEFLCSDLRHLRFESCFDYVVSYETVEHLDEECIPMLFDIFSRSLRPSGALIFSTPYLQPRSPEAIRMGFHQTFDIDEGKIREWASRSGLEVKLIKYQNYQTHDLEDALEHKDFVICVANKP